MSCSEDAYIPRHVASIWNSLESAIKNMVRSNLLIEDSNLHKLMRFNDIVNIWHLQIYTWIKIYHLDITNFFIKMTWILHLSFIFGYFFNYRKTKNILEGNKSRFWNKIVLLFLVVPSIINLDFLNEQCLSPNRTF